METVYPRHLMIVLLGSTNRFGEGAALLQRGWQLIRSMGGRRSGGRFKENALIAQNEATDWCSDQRWRLPGT